MSSDKSKGTDLIKKGEGKESSCFRRSWYPLSGFNVSDIRANKRR